MSVIYKPSGRAREYADLALNIYKGCEHRCEYCFGPATLRKKKEDFFSNPDPKKNIIDRLRRDAENWKEEKKPVLLSFVSDPYQAIDSKLELTRQAIIILKKNGFPIKILTKAGTLAIRDFGILDSNDWFGVSLTCSLESERKRLEPGAAIINDRINNLKWAKRCGLNTWVSLEPIISPTATVELIKKTNKFVDHYKAGKLNYHQEAKQIEEVIGWDNVANMIIDQLEQVNADYYIKNSLKEHLEGN
ncbi:SPL family radical SAM protein [Fuchsiella alkaliacetigena]|uniref:SPL family radical SAM protein n=1 Tax=Fuchsiella alkaliacetigena TaxID=957042 RepID=UPI002009FB53|nr:radical SAM protein [Fuchsiella alkaliacetigena]MCK8824712.1 hypothetical protein [Fuchsiella alkaliacetigena]